MSSRSEAGVSRVRKLYGGRLPSCATVEWLPLAAGQGLDEEKISVTLSAFLSSVLSANTPHPETEDRGVDGMRSPSVDEGGLRRLKTYRKSFAATEIAIPATALRNRAIATWVRDHRMKVDVHTGEDLAAAIAAGVQLARLTVYAGCAEGFRSARCGEPGSRPGSRRFGPADRSAQIGCRAATRRMSSSG